MKTIKIIFFYLRNRFVLFSVFVGIFIIIQSLTFKTLLPSTETKDLWFYSGLFMVVFSILFIDPYFTSPKNVITNSIPLLLVIISIKNDLLVEVFWVTIGFLSLLIISSIVTMTLSNTNLSENHLQNRIATYIKNIIIIFGRGKVLYSIVFFYFLLTYYSNQNLYTLITLIIWGIFIDINPKDIHNSFKISSELLNEENIAEIIGVESKKVYVAKLCRDKQNTSKFDLVKFRYSLQTEGNDLFYGVVLDVNLLSTEKWIKVLQIGEPQVSETHLTNNFVYKITDKEELENVEKQIKSNKLVGVVDKGSDIGNIFFEYSKRVDDLEEGDLLELNNCGKRVFYQCTNGTTDKERLEEINENGIVRGEAIQLGEWQEESCLFNKFGWVPPINTAVYKADTSNIRIPQFSYPHFSIGFIPGTNLPMIMNLHDAISHHLALLGVTGSGKTFFAHLLIKELIQDTKVICVDLSGEWSDKLHDLKPTELIPPDGISKVEELMANKDAQTKAKNAPEILKLKKQIQERLIVHITDYINSDNNLAILDLPDISNTTYILEFTQLFLEGVFIFAKNNPGQRLCLVLEEAHTLIPESSFLGELGEYSSNKGLVSKMGQIALQGRKFGVGLMIIAQRTAIVSKTVLTQCNTIVSFQAFDETSINFLKNYFGAEMIKVMPNLKPYHAIVTGKAIKSNIPMIVDLTR